MNYLSLSFAAFVLLLMLVYYLVPKKARGAVLLCGSLVFYGLFDVRYFLFLLFTALTTFFAAKLLVKSSKKKLILASCIAVNAAVWFVIKDLAWIAETAVRAFSVLGITVSEPVFALIVPVGISYYTLQSIGYLIDVSKGKIVPENRFWKYLLFISYFPAIVQGPISRYDKLMPQLLNTEKFSYENARRSIVLILFGLVKKMVIADRIGIFVNSCFGNFTELHGIILYIAAVGYAIQLYLDFSGCVDICRGVSGLFGVELVHNFNRPYLSGSVKEFWSKWHMSLSSWLKDYVYIPLGGNRKGTFRKYLNLLITFLVSGLWHGAGFNFFFWGIMHAVYQIIGQVTAGIRQKFSSFIGLDSDSATSRIVKTVITFNLVTLAWIFFRSEGLQAGMQYVSNMFSQPDLWRLFDGSIFTFGVGRGNFTIVLLHIAALFILELRTSCQEDITNGLLRRHLITRWTVYLILIFDILLFGVCGSGYNLSSFMYGGF